MCFAFVESYGCSALAYLPQRKAGEQQQARNGERSRNHHFHSVYRFHVSDKNWLVRSLGQVYSFA